MGVFDTIHFNCPNCNLTLHAQSKSGDCTLSDYPASAVPLSVALDANRHAPIKCECGAQYEFHIPERVRLVVVRVDGGAKENEQAIAFTISDIEKMMTQASEAYCQGQEARKLNQPKESKESKDVESWIRGWNDMDAALRNYS